MEVYKTGARGTKRCAHAVDWMWHDVVSYKRGFCLPLIYTHSVEKVNKRIMLQEIRKTVARFMIAPNRKNSPNVWKDALQVLTPYNLSS